MAAHRAIIDGKGFKENLIPRRASQLAARLSRAIAPLFTTSSNSSEDALFHTWGEPLEVWQNRRAHLEEIFQTALSLKADSIVTKCRYEFAIYPPGTSFLEEAITEKNSRKTQDGKSWLHASFHIYDDTPTVGKSKEAALVLTDNFVKKADEERVGAKYTKSLIFPKRFDEALPNQVTELEENSDSRCINVAQTSAGLDTGAHGLAIGDRNSKTVETAGNHSGAEEATNSDQSKDSPLPKCAECGKEFQAVSLLRRHEKNSKESVDFV